MTTSSARVISVSSCDTAVRRLVTACASDLTHLNPPTCTPVFVCMCMSVHADICACMHALMRSVRTVLNVSSVVRDF